jgi:benzoyl-CoA reductase/2-hydroxyglutaryl-CoA dehydratase subunit BcrC/BadD/HgdB
VDRRRQDELIQGAGQVLSMFMGGRSRTRSLSGLSRRRSATRGVRNRLESAHDKFEDDQEAITEMESELAEELEQLWDDWKEKAERIEPFEVPLEKDDIRVEQVVLFWAPAD